MGIGFQLESELVVDERLWALAYTGPTVIEEPAGLGTQKAHETHVTCAPDFLPKAHVPLQKSGGGGGTYEAVRVLRARAAARTLVVAALVGVGPKAVTVALGGTDGLGHCGRRGNSRQSSHDPVRRLCSPSPSCPLGSSSPHTHSWGGKG